MAQAKTLTDSQLEKVRQSIVAEGKNPIRDLIMIALSFEAGMCAQEIAWIEVDDVTDAEGNLDNVIRISKSTRKLNNKPCKTYRRARVIPMSPNLQKLLGEYLKLTGVKTGPLLVTHLGETLTPDGVQKQFRRIYQRAGFYGVSSHSGRRTFLTRVARMVGPETECSIFDVQNLAGHADIGTTACYVEMSDKRRKLVASVWGK